MTNEIFGWVCILASVAMGLWMGLRFQQEDWLGGYGTLRRRMVRLAHIALAALGIVNIEFGRSVGELALSSELVRAISAAFIVAGISMPATMNKPRRGWSARTNRAASVSLRHSFSG